MRTNLLLATINSSFRHKTITHAYIAARYEHISCCQFEIQIRNTHGLTQSCKTLIIFVTLTPQSSDSANPSTGAFKNTGNGERKF